MVKALPSAELVVLDRVGHSPWLEDPAAFARATRDSVIDTTIATARPDPAGDDSRR